MAYMTFQSSLGEASHFNRSTTFHDVMYSLMGMGALTLTVTTAYLGWRIRSREPPPCTSQPAGALSSRPWPPRSLLHISPAARPLDRRRPDRCHGAALLPLVNHRRRPPRGPFCRPSPHASRAPGRLVLARQTDRSRSLIAGVASWAACPPRPSWAFRCSAFEISLPLRHIGGNDSGTLKYGQGQEYGRSFRKSASNYKVFSKGHGQNPGRGAIYRRRHRGAGGAGARPPPPRHVYRRHR